MTRIPFHRPTRALPPPTDAEQIVLPPPPQDGQQPGAAGSMWLSLLLPLMSSISMAAYMIIYHNVLLIILGISFVVFSIAVTVFVRYQMKDAARKTKTRQRGRYMQFLIDVKLTARSVAANQRLTSAWIHPSPERLWAIAHRRRRVWERRSGDEDFLLVRVGAGRGPLATAIQLGTRGDPMAEYDEKAYAEARKVVARFSTVGRQPALVNLGRAGVVSVLGPAEQTRALARALLCQVAVLHAPDDVAPDPRSVLEAMPAAAAHQPDVVERRMPVDDEVGVGRDLVLADARLDDRRVGERRHP